MQLIAVPHRCLVSCVAYTNAWLFMTRALQVFSDSVLTLLPLIVVYLSPRIHTWNLSSPLSC